MQACMDGWDVHILYIIVFVFSLLHIKVSSAILFNFRMLSISIHDCYGICSNQAAWLYDALIRFCLLFTLKLNPFVAFICKKQMKSRRVLSLSPENCIFCIIFKDNIFHGKTISVVKTPTFQQNALFSIILKIHWKINDIDGQTA